jgi:hypothetical protein
MRRFELRLRGRVAGITAGIFGVVLTAALIGCVVMSRTPAPVATAPPAVQVTPRAELRRLEGWVPYWVDEAKVVQEAIEAGFTDVLLFHGTVEESGQVKLEQPQGLERGRVTAVRGGVRTWLTATNHGKSLEGALGQGRLESHVDSLLAAFETSKCQHLDLDYESMTLAQARQLPELARMLDARLEHGVRLAFTLQPVDTVHRPSQREMVRELLAMPRVHTVRFMMYDYAWRNSLPGALCPLPEFRRLLDTWAGHGEKLTVCLPLYGYDWPRPEDTSVPRADVVTLRDVPSLSAEFVWMQHEAELAARYTKDGVPRMAAVPSHRAVQVRVQTALDYGVAGVSFWHLGCGRLAPVAQATQRGSRVPEPVRYTEIGGWSDWLTPFKERVCRVITGDGSSLDALAQRHNADPATMRRFNTHLANTTNGQTVYIP